MAANPPFETHDKAFGDVLGDAPRLARVVDVDAHEGPVYLPEEDALLFTTVPRRVLWQDLQELLGRIKIDFDPMVPEVRAAWEASH